MKKKIALILIICMVISSFGITFAASHSDIHNHWAEEVIREWMNQEMLSGYPDGSFRPNNDITRAEFMVLVNKAFDYKRTTAINYTDVASSDWYYDVVAIATASGYIGGYPDGSMLPNNPISRQEVTVVLSKLMGLGENPEGINVFEDADAIPEWSKGYIGSAVEAGYMGGYPDGTFKAINNITRAEAVFTLNRVLKTIEVEVIEEKEEEEKVEEKNQEVSNSSGRRRRSSSGSSGGLNPPTVANNVNTQERLQEAIDNKNIATINITGDIVGDFQFNRSVTISAANNVITGDVILGTGDDIEIELRNLEVTGTLTVDVGDGGDVVVNNATLNNVIINSIARDTFTLLGNSDVRGSMVVNTPARIWVASTTARVSGRVEINRPAKLEAIEEALEAFTGRVEVTSSYKADENEVLEIKAPIRRLDIKPLESGDTRVVSVVGGNRVLNANIQAPVKLDSVPKAIVIGIGATIESIDENIDLNADIDQAKSEGTALELAFAKEDLQEAIDEARKLQIEEYTTSSWQVLREAFVEARSLLDDEGATKEEIKVALDNLITAMDGLERRVTVGAVRNLQADIGAGNVKLSWDAVNKAEDYHVEYTLEEGFIDWTEAWQRGTVTHQDIPVSSLQNPEAPEYVIRNLESKAYRIKVYAMIGDAWGPWEEIVVTPDPKDAEEVSIELIFDDGGAFDQDYISGSGTLRKNNEVVAGEVVAIEVFDQQSKPINITEAPKVITNADGQFYFAFRMPQGNLGEFTLKTTALELTKNFNFTVEERETTVPVDTLHTVILEANPSAAGYVTGGGSYKAGDLVTLTAVADEEYIFINWTNDQITVVEQVYQFKMPEKNLHFVGNFKHEIFDGGVGTVEEPWVINTSQQLDQVRYYLDSHFILNRDIDLSNYSSGSGWNPIGDRYNTFNGSLDGNGKRITNLHMDYPTEDYIGLFAHTSEDAKIKHLTIEGVSIIGSQNIGALVGRNAGNILHVSVINETAEIAIEGDSFTGAITGANAATGNIAKSFGSANVKTANSSAGGLVGVNHGLIAESLAAGSVYGYTSTGGLVGHNNGGSIINSFAMGDVIGIQRNTIGSSNQGGLVGRNQGGTILNSYATGEAKSTGAGSTGGLVASNTGEVINSYYDKNTTGNADTGKGEGKTTAQMRQQTTYIGWDFDEIWNIAPAKNSGYPYLYWQSLKSVEPTTVTQAVYTTNTARINMPEDWVPSLALDNSNEFEIHSYFDYESEYLVMIFSDEVGVIDQEIDFVQIDGALTVTANVYSHSMIPQTVYFKLHEDLAPGLYEVRIEIDEENIAVVKIYKAIP